MKKVVIIIILIAIGGGIFYWRSSSSEESQIKKVVTKNPTKGSIVDSIKTDGVIEIKNKESIFLSKTQRVEKVYFEEGDEVKKGDTLISFDISERDDIKRQIEIKKLEIENQKLNLQEYNYPESNINLLNQKRRIESLETNLEKLREKVRIANLEKSSIEKEIEEAKKDFKVKEKLYEIEGISYTEYSNAKDSVENLEESLEKKLSTIKEFEIDIEDTKSEIALEKKRYEDEKVKQSQKLETNEVGVQKIQNGIKRLEIEINSLENELEKTLIDIKSPVSGTIIEINAEENFRASLEKPLMEIADINSQIIKASVLSYDVRKLKLGQDVIITSEALEEGFEMKGKLTKIATIATEETGSGYSDVVVDIEVDFDVSNSILKPGFRTDLEIIVTRKDGVIIIPSFAIQSENKKEYILVVDKQNIIQKKYIEKGIETNSLVEVDNIDKSEKIVMNPTAVVVGEKVEIQDSIKSDVPERKGGNPQRGRR